MNILQKIALSSTPTKIVWGICTGLVLVTIGVGACNGVRISNDVKRASELESSYVSLENTYNSKLLDASAGSTSSVVDAELYTATEAGSLIAIWQHTMSIGSELSAEEMVGIQQMMQDHMDRWLMLDNVEYVFLTNVNFSEAEFPVAWSAKTSDGTLLAYITATYNAQENTFDDFHVSRTVHYDEIVNTTIATATPAPTQPTTDATDATDTTETAPADSETTQTTVTTEETSDNTDTGASQPYDHDYNDGLDNQEENNG